MRFFVDFLSLQGDDKKNLHKLRLAGKKKDTMSFGKCQTQDVLNIPDSRMG